MKMNSRKAEFLMVTATVAWGYSYRLMKLLHYHKLQHNGVQSTDSDYFVAHMALLFNQLHNGIYQQKRLV